MQPFRFQRQCRPLVQRCVRVVVLACCGWIAVSCGRGPTPEDAYRRRAEQLALPPLPASFQRGMNIEPIGDYGATLQLDALPQALEDLRHLGVDHVALIPSFFQPHLGDTAFVWKGSRSQILADTRTAIRIAHAHGMSVLLKPHLWLQDRSEGWRGDIDPTAEQWPAWSAAYREAVLEAASVAADEGVQALSLGSELSAIAVAHPEFWRALASDARAAFAGRITYAANWDQEFEAIDWWDAVDAIGVDAFWPLVDSAEEQLSPAACRQRLAAVRTRLRAVSERFDRPVIVTEIGYKSATGAAYRPWEWHRAQRPDPALQDLLYECIVRTFGQPPAPWLAGVYFWVWYTDPGWGGPDNSGFTPRGKPAQDVLRVWFKYPR